MKVISFDKTLFASTGQLFPESISKDGLVIYHGTSNHFEDGIERNGFSCSNPVVQKGEITALCSIFSIMNWAGTRGGGYPVLRPFSLSYDLKDSKRSLLFFGETASRCLYFATRTNAGGEKARATRLCLEDLDEYLVSTELRRLHDFELQEKANWKSTIHETAPRKVPVNLEWLRLSIQELTELKKRLQVLHETFRHGVIYALRVLPEDLKHFQWDSMGLSTCLEIPKDRILAKVIIPCDFEFDPMAYSASRDFHETQLGQFFLLRSRFESLWSQKTEAGREEFVSSLIRDIWDDRG